MVNDPYSPPKNNWLSIVGLILFIIPICIWGLWIDTFNTQQDASQAERVEIFLSYFPSFLRTTHSISITVLASSAASIVFTLVGLIWANTFFRVLAIFVVFILILVIVLQLFTML
jgi:hypothetical protein